MHDIEPFYSWEKYYSVTQDERSPFYGKEYPLFEYVHTIYGYYIHPYWDDIGSETLYLKVLFTDYERGFVIIELLGEWNDAIYNDIMHFKRNLIDYLCKQGIKYFILIGENVLNFHGSDDCYYEEWFEDVEDGWIAAINFRDFVLKEMSIYNIDSYLISGGELDDFYNWRTLPPLLVCQKVRQAIEKRIALF
ncbi:MAG: hypothetical protein JJT94_16465 [Bernardetiaceae bacterium]|nr:hypothetical protein [Bernardetiaceae bacterium]